MLPIGSVGMVIQTTLFVIHRALNWGESAFYPIRRRRRTHERREGRAPGTGPSPDVGWILQMSKNVPRGKPEAALQFLLASSPRFPAPSPKLRARSPNLPSPSSGFRAASPNFGAASSNFRAASSNLRSASSNFRSACSNFRSACSSTSARVLQLPRRLLQFPCRSSNLLEAAPLTS